MIFRAHGRFVESRSAGATSPPKTSARARPTWTSCTWRRTTSPGSPAGRAIRRPSPRTACSARSRRRRRSAGAPTTSRARRSPCRAAGTWAYYLAQGAARRTAPSSSSPTSMRSACQRVVDEFGATAVELDDIYGVKADIFAPCALGGIINDDTIPQLKVEIVAGAANNQLLEERHGDALEAREHPLRARLRGQRRRRDQRLQRARRMGSRSAPSARPTRSTTPCSACSRSPRATGSRPTRPPTAWPNGESRRSVDGADLAAVAEPLK